MDRSLASARLYSIAPPDLLYRSPPFARSVNKATCEQTGGPSSPGLLLLSLGIWAAVWTALASLSSWLR
jgi:hypothetical protein